MQESRFDNREDFDLYMKKLEKKNIPVKIVSDTEQTDGSIVCVMKMQYLNYGRFPRLNMIKNPRKLCKKLSGLFIRSAQTGVNHITRVSEQHNYSLGHGDFLFRP